MSQRIAERFGETANLINATPCLTVLKILFGAIGMNFDSWNGLYIRGTGIELLVRELTK